MSISIQDKIADIYNEMKYCDISTRRIAEYIFATASIVLFILYKTQVLPRELIIATIVVWAFLAVTGVFIPTITQTHIFSGEELIPIVFRASAKGGFIAGQKIKLKAYVVDIQKGQNSKGKFQDTFDEYDIICLKSIALPITKGQFLPGEPQTGGVSLNMETCEGKKTVLYHEPGIHELTVTFKKRNSNIRQTLVNGDPRVKPTLTISPAENYIQFRFYSITYGLTLLVLLLTCIGLGII